MVNLNKMAADSNSNFDDQLSREVAKNPLRRLAKPLEVTQAIRFLLSKESDFINGVILVLDGGLTVCF